MSIYTAKPKANLYLFAFQPSIANATNIDTLLAGTEGKEEINVPPEALQDKVFFIFNNLSLSNMETKVGWKQIGSKYSSLFTIKLCSIITLV